MRNIILIIAAFVIMTACQRGMFNSTLSVGELTKEYEKSSKAVRSKYDGKEITVRGYSLIGATLPRDDDDAGLISLDEKDGDPLLSVTCWFRQPDATEFAKIKGEQFVTVKGIFDGEITTDLKFCKLVKVE